MANLSNINNKFIVTDGGNVLIGTTADVAAVRLQVKNAGAAAVLRLTGGSDSWDFDTYYTDNKLFIKSSGAAGTVMTLLGASGNVGIGTDSPQEKLHVVGLQGSVPLSSYYGSLVVDNNGEAAISIIGNSYSSIYFGDAATNFAGAVVYNHSANAMEFRTNTNVEKMRISSNGNVTIGNTASVQPLTVAGAVLFRTTTADGFENRFQFLGGGAGDPGNFYVYNAVETATVRINAGGDSYFNGGNVGIGLTGPTAKLHVFEPTANTGVALKIQSYSWDANLLLINDQGTWEILNDRTGLGTNGTLAFYNGGYRMALTPAGNLGIGTTSPYQKLQVNGKAIIGTSANYTSGAGALSVNSVGDNNGGIVDTHSNGGHRYYTRVCHAATSGGSAGYWHIKTNITIDSSTMFLAKFYGYVYGQAGITDLQHGGYAYNNGSGGAVINQVTTNNSSNTGMTSAIYTSTTGNKLCFRIDLNGSTYYAGLWMDIGFQNPTGGSWNFNIEGTTFNATANYY